VFIAAAETELGGNPKFELSGERLRTISGGWVRDDLAELTVASIYRGDSGGREFGLSAVAAGDKEGHRLRDFVSTAVAGSPASMRQP
jgi:hypothetical protein